MAQTKQDRGKLGEQVLGLESGEKILDKAVGFTFLGQKKDKSIQEQDLPCLSAITILKIFRYRRFI